MDLGSRYRPQNPADILDQEHFELGTEIAEPVREVLGVRLSLQTMPVLKNLPSRESGFVSVDYLQCKLYSSATVALQIFGTFLRQALATSLFDDHLGTLRFVYCHSGAAAKHHLRTLATDPLESEGGHCALRVDPGIFLAWLEVRTSVNSLERFPCR